jgi:trans-2,3-dihydro-3-hydroxyanthranilate isomerase
MTGDWLDYEVVDVFTATPFTGNPLAVVLGADDLETTALQAIAREFALSETAFPMAATTGADYRLRIFTPEVELPFAGHPSIGTAWLLAQRGELSPGAVVQSCGAGELTVQVAPGGGPVTLTGGTPTVGPPLGLDGVLRAVGLTARDLIGVEPRACGTGLEFHYLLVRAGAVARCRPEPAPCARWVRRGCRSSPGTGTPRTPGSSPVASASRRTPPPARQRSVLGVYLVATGLLADGGSYVVRQGAELGRPSRLDCTVAAVHGAAVAASVTDRWCRWLWGGSGALMSAGSLGSAGARRTPRPSGGPLRRAR